jgi:hypothetical protein
MSQSTSKTRISEFDWLKVIGLFLLIFVHSDLYADYPSVIYSVEWILISIFFFVSGYLVYNSFLKRNFSIKSFFKAKFWSLYIPFILAASFYFGFEVSLGVTANPLRLLSHLSLLDVFDKLNAGLYNWGFLWFIPYLLVFMLIFCLLEKYVKNPKLQVTLGLVVWFLSILGWVFDASFKLGLVFSQFFLVFMFGFWLSKFSLYDKIFRARYAVLAIPAFVFFWFDFSNLLNFNTLQNSLVNYFYFNVRITTLGLSTIFLFLLILKNRVSSNRVVESIAKVSIIIYLTEPFLSYLLRDFIFSGQRIIESKTSEFIIYQALRIALLFGLLPLLYMAAKKYRVSSKISSRLKCT